MAEVLSAADAARRLGPEVVLVTSVLRQDGPPGTIDMVAVNADGAWPVTTPRLPQTFTGSGDVTAATFLARLLDAGDVPGALAHTAAVIYGLLAGHGCLRWYRAGSDRRSGRTGPSQPYLPTGAPPLMPVGLRLSSSKGASTGSAHISAQSRKTSMLAPRALSLLARSS